MKGSRDQVKPLSEEDMIALWLAPLAGPAGLGLRDDAALVDVPDGFQLVTTVDALVSGVHFFADDPPASIARKVLGVNLSDLAAKGATPHGFLLSMALPKDWPQQDLRSFIEALGVMAKAFDCPLIGGDTTTTSGPLTFSLTAFGLVPKGQMVRRTTMQSKDLIAVTGSIGDAALGLLVKSHPEAGWVKKLTPAARAYLRDRYLHPQPRIGFAGSLRRIAHAAMDVSDGLVGDLAKMLRASGHTGRVEVETVPFSPAVEQALMLEPSLLETVLTGGDDYEILFSFGLHQLETVQQAAQDCGLCLSVIGAVDRYREAPSAPLKVFYRGQAMTFAHGSYQHF
jgi:thiamine-monophosphate kinase